MPPVNRVDQARVKQLLEQGCTPKQICLRLGVNKSSVHVVQRAMKEGKS